MSMNETNAETTLHQQEMQQRRENILDLLDIMDEGNLTALRFKDGNMEIELERTPAPGSISSSALPLMAERVGQLLNAREDASGVTAGAASAPLAAEDDSVSVVRSPMVGTFYAGPSPDEDPFVKVGQEVLTGQTLAIVEAMKMMNEITAPAPGVVTEVLAANGTQVEYDQPLFRISTSANA
ncbi:acetyl-CoA carboxylase biotin carboxyl carrier protein [uncultured Senegalimassilia sp.]|uniref:acetyl-CoA carboxylase biotin carboxyl carrier protein n=1 Tax=uncultured Senegalimassilia sp. TaxID=1714350 RepID=UPI002670EE44|nr:acetyl-CoA carboxylase biotin carboxyl carrier protein [uncultured Senegalimassilia sp.]